MWTGRTNRCSGLSTSTVEQCPFLHTSYVRPSSPYLGSVSTLAMMSRLSPMTRLSDTSWKIGATFLPTRAVGVAMSSLARKWICSNQYAYEGLGGIRAVGASLLLVIGPDRAGGADVH